MDDYWTVQQLADAAGLSGSHVRLLLGRGTFEGASKRGGAWFIPHATAAEWIRDRMARKWARAVKKVRDV